MLQPFRFMGRTNRKKRQGIFPLDAGSTKKAKNPPRLPQTVSKETPQADREPVPIADTSLENSSGKRFQVRVHFGN